MELPYIVAAGKLESNSEEEYNETGEQFSKNYKYIESFATLEEAQAALKTVKGYHFVEFQYHTTDNKLIDLLGIHEQIKKQEPATPRSTGVKNRTPPEFHWLQTVEFLVLGRVVMITGDTEKTGFIAELVDDKLEITGQIDSATLNTLRRTDNVKIAVMQLPNHIPMEVAYMDKKYEQFLAR